MEGEEAQAEASGRATCETHGLAVGQDGLCVLCRRVSSPTRTAVPILPILGVIVVVIVAVLAV